MSTAEERRQPLGDLDEEFAPTDATARLRRAQREREQRPPGRRLVGGVIGSGGALGMQPSTDEELAADDPLAAQE